MQDLEFWLRIIFLAKEITFTPYIVTRYFVRNEGASQQRSLERFPSVIRIYDLLDEFYRNNGLEEFAQYRDEAILSAAIFFFMCWFLEEHPNSDFDCYRDRLAVLLQSMPEKHLDVFLTEPIGSVLLEFRSKNYIKAAHLLSISRSG